MATVVQAASAANNTGTNSNLVVTFGSNVTAGNAIIIWGQSSSNVVPNYDGVVATDGGSDAFTFLQEVDDSTNGQFGGLWFTNSSVGGFTTVTLSFSTFSPAGGSLTGFSTMTVFEVSGLASSSASDTGNFNVAATGGSSATNGDTSGSFTTSQAGDFIVAGFFNDNGPGTAWTAGTSPISFTIPSGGSTGLGASNPHAMQYGTFSGSGAINPAITLGNTGGYIAIGWSFKAPASTAVTFEDDSFAPTLPAPFDPIVSVW